MMSLTLPGISTGTGKCPVYLIMEADGTGRCGAYSFPGECRGRLLILAVLIKPVFAKGCSWNNAAYGGGAYEAKRAYGRWRGQGL